MKFPPPTRFLTLLAALLFLPGCATMQDVAGRLAAVRLLGLPREIPQRGGPQIVVISKSDQTLRAYDGGKLVFRTRVSTGREGKRTPDGRFQAQAKDPMHFSSLYHNAPMPYSVQFSGNYFIHGFSQVPHRPASHGCIRLPLQEGGRHPAREFYDWIRVGTPIRVTGDWLG